MKLRERVGVEHRLAHLARRQGRRARYRGVRKNLYDLRRACAIQNLETIQRKPRNEIAFKPVSVLEASEVYLADINRFPLLKVEEEQDLARTYLENGDSRAAHRLVTANLRFVVKVAYQYRSYGFSMADLIQEGNLGLMKAVQKFDPDKGTRLLTYAVWWIHAYIRNYMVKSFSLVKLGTTQLRPNGSSSSRSPAPSASSTR